MVVSAVQNAGAYKRTVPGHNDWYYGGGEVAWTDMATAILGVPIWRRPGQTIGVIENGIVIEYIWPATGDVSGSPILKISQGPKGDKGDPGATGAKGDTGPAGADGAPGTKGDQGIPGVKGADGAPGIKGDQGIPGVKGDTGAAGTKGDQGIPGVKGDTGAAGTKGDQGIPGVKGDPGATGAKGDTGPAGPVLIASDAEIQVNTSTGTDNTKAVTALGLFRWWKNYQPTLPQTFTSWIKALYFTLTPLTTPGSLIEGSMWYNIDLFFRESTFTNKILKQQNNSAFTGTTNRMLSTSIGGDISASNDIVEGFNLDSDVQAAIVGATYVNGRANLTNLPAGKYFYQGTEYCPPSGNYIYKAILDNVAVRMQIL